MQLFRFFKTSLFLSIFCPNLALKNLKGLLMRSSIFIFILTEDSYHYALIREMTQVTWVKHGTGGRSLRHMKTDLEYHSHRYWGACPYNTVLLCTVKSSSFSWQRSTRVHLLAIALNKCRTQSGSVFLFVSINASLTYRILVTFGAIWTPHWWRRNVIISRHRTTHRTWYGQVKPLYYLIVNNPRLRRRRRRWLVTPMTTTMSTTRNCHLLLSMHGKIL